jgi:hypothetical protein
MVMKEKYRVLAVSFTLYVVAGICGFFFDKVSGFGIAAFLAVTGMVAISIAIVITFLGILMFLEEGRD